MIVLAGTLDVEDEEKMRSWRILEFPAWSTLWIFSLINFMDGLTFTEFIPLTQKEGAGLGNGSGEEDYEFSFGHFGFDLEYPVGKIC